MPEEIQDVNQAEESSAPVEDVETQEVVTEPVDDSQGETPETQPAPQTPVPDSKQDVDEFGVPWKNRAMEYRRKSEDLAERLPSMLEEAINKKTEKPQYSRQQLEAFEKEYVDNPQYAGWAKDELRKMDKEENKATFREELTRFKTEQENTVKRQQANNYTVQHFPDAFLRGVNGQYLVDRNGDPVPNGQNPIGQIMSGYLNDADLQKRPDKLFLASKLAYADYMSSTQGKSIQKQQQLKEEVSSLQRKTLIEGGGRTSPQSVPAHRKALDRLAQTGSAKDAQVALDLLLKSKQKE